MQLTPFGHDALISPPSDSALDNLQGAVASSTGLPDGLGAGVIPRVNARSEVPGAHVSHMVAPAHPLLAAHPPLADPQEDSLDLEATGSEESHFIGSGAISGIALNESTASKHSSATLSFRQVSNTPGLPAFFVKHPSLIYGRAEAGKDTFEAVCRELSWSPADALARALTR